MGNNNINKNNGNNKFTFRDFVRVVFRRKVMFITPVVIIMLTVYFGLMLQVPLYTARVVIGVYGKKPTWAPYYKKMEEGHLIYWERQFLTSDRVIEQAVNILKLYERPLDYEKRFSSKLKAFLIDYRLKKSKLRLEELTPEERHDLLFRRAVNSLKGGISVKQLHGVMMFYVSVTDFDPTAVVAITNILSRVYIINTLERQLADIQLKYREKHPLSMQIRDNIDELKKSLHKGPIQGEKGFGPASVKIIKPAKWASLVKAKFNKRIVLILSFFIGVVLGIMVAFGLEHLEDTFKSSQDVTLYLNIPFLGSIPKRKSKDELLIKDSTLTTDYARFYEDLCDRIYLLIRDKNLETVLITDAEFSEDTAAVIANIGFCVARKETDYKVLTKELNHKVLIIDANLRAPSISKVFNVSNGHGLTDVLQGKVSFEDAVQDMGSNLYVLTAGSSVFLNPTILLGSPNMTDVIKTAKERYGTVFFACADVKNFTDSAILSSSVDGTVLVINEGKVRLGVVKNAIAPLQQKEANLIGAILNNRTFPIPKIIYDRI